MSRALVQKVNVYSAGKGAPGLLQSPDYTQKTVARADVSVFHDMSPNRSEAAGQGGEVQDYDAGLKDGKAQSDLVYQNTILVMQNALDALQGQMSEISKQIEASHLAAVQSCLSSALPALMAAGVTFEIQALIAQAAKVGRAGKVHFTVHPDAEQDCQRLCELNDLDFKISVDASLPSRGVQAAWDNGGADVECQTALSEFLARIDGVLELLNPNSQTEQHNG